MSVDNALITDNTGNIVEEFSFDTWGKRRAPNLNKIIAELGAWNTLDAYQKANLTILETALSSTVTNKGFTGHEQMDDVELIHMNGRVYDAEIGRFVSADPFVPVAGNLQALNRYSYVLNNPLSYTDPSGFFLKKAFKKLVKAIKNVVSAFVKAHVNVARGVLRAIGKVPGLSTAASIAMTVFVPTCQNGWCAAAFNAAVSTANGATFGDVLQGAAVGYVAHGLPGGGGIGGLSGGIARGLGEFGKSVYGQFTAVATASGASAKAMGGRFIDGVKGAAIGLGVSLGFHQLRLAVAEQPYDYTYALADAGDCEASQPCRSAALAVDAQQTQQTEPHLIKDIGALIDDPAKFAQCTIDCASEVLGVDTAAKAGVAASGLNVLPASGKPGGTTPGTSPASKFFRSIFGDLRFPRRVPAPTLKQGISARTIKVGTFAGRVVPIAGTASLFPDARALDQCVATCVRPGE